MWKGEEMSQSLSRAEEEVARARDQCPRPIVRMEDIETGAPMGGEEGGGYSGEGGAGMRPLPEWFGEAGTGATAPLGKSPHIR